jgi:hypothetical protein
MLYVTGLQYELARKTSNTFIMDSRFKVYSIINPYPMPQLPLDPFTYT